MQDLANDMDSVEQRSRERLVDLMKQSYHGECSAVSAVHKLASQAAFTGQVLPYQLDLEVATQPYPCTPALIISPHFCLGRPACKVHFVVVNQTYLDYRGQ